MNSANRGWEEMVDLEECRRLMRERDHNLLLTREQSTLRALADEVPGLVAEVERLRAEVDALKAATSGVLDARDLEKDKLADAKLQVRDAKKLLREFSQDARVCQAIAKDCIGGHQEGPCQCLYCRARDLVFQMDEGQC